MKNWIRIILVFFVLIGGVVFFGYWSFNQFNDVFDNLNASYIANTPSIPLSDLSDEINKEQTSTALPLPETVTDLTTKKK